MAKDKELKIRCAAECTDCKNVKLKCDQNWDFEEDSDAQGVVHGAGIGGG